MVIVSGKEWFCLFLLSVSEIILQVFFHVMFITIKYIFVIKSMRGYHRQLARLDETSLSTRMLGKTNTFCSSK